MIDEIIRNVGNMLTEIRKLPHEWFHAYQFHSHPQTAVVGQFVETRLIDRSLSNAIESVRVNVH